MPAERGEICGYRSIEGGVFTAKIVAVHPDGTVDAEVMKNGKVAITRHKIQFSEDPGFQPKGSAFRKLDSGKDEAK